MESLTHVESGVGDFPYSLDKPHCFQVLNSSIVLVFFLIPVYWERSIFSIHSCSCCEYVIDFVRMCPNPLFWTWEEKEVLCFPSCLTWNTIVCWGNGLQRVSLLVQQGSDVRGKSLLAVFTEECEVCAGAAHL